VANSSAWLFFGGDNLAFTVISISMSELGFFASHHKFLRVRYVPQAEVMVSEMNDC
jgi:hypothetical protein